MTLNESAKSVASSYDHWTHWISETSGASDPMLHTQAGLAAFVLAWLLLRRPLASGLPLLIVLLLALLNEVLDYFHQGLLWPEAGVDVLITCFWPLALTLTARARGR